MKKLIFLVGSVITGIIVFLGGYAVGYGQRMPRMETIETAFRQQVIQYHWDGLTSNDVEPMTFPNGTITASNNGYFILGEFPTSDHPNNDRYLLAYGWLDQGAWEFTILGWVGPGQGGGTDAPTTIGGRMVPLSAAWQWAPNNKAIEAVGMVKYQGLGKSSPYPMQRVGNMPLWVHKFDTQMFMATPYKGFDQNGHVVWDMMDHNG